MEITKDIFEWLLSYQIISPADLANDSQEDQVTLDDLTTQKFQNGLKIAKLIKILYTRSKKDKKMLKQLESVSDHGDPTTKLENWKAISILSMALGASLDVDSQKLIAFGDFGLLADYISTLKKADDTIALSIKQPNIVSMGSQGIDINTLNENKSIASSANSLELVILSICQCFNMKPKQAAGQLTEGSKYLAKIILQGVKGEYKSVVGWYQELYANSKRLSKLMSSESIDQCMQVLASLKFGFYCKNIDVAEWCVRLYNKLSADLSSSQHSKGVYNWFLSDEGGIDGLLYLISKHEKIEGYAIEYLFIISAGNIESTILTTFPPKFKSNKLFLSFLSDIVARIVGSKLLKSKANDESLLNSIAKRLSAEASTDWESSYIKMKILVCIWCELLDSIEEGQEIANYILASLRKMCKDKHITVSYMAYSMLFKLFEVFSEALKPHAPVIYKTITFMLIEDFNKADIKEFIIHSIISIFVKIPSIPIILFFDPFIKQMTVQLDYFPNQADLYAFNYIVNHSKFNPKYSVPCLNYLSKVIYKNIYQSAPAASILEVVIQRFVKGEEALISYIVKFAKLLLTTYTDIKSAKPAPIKNKNPKATQTQVIDDNENALTTLFFGFSIFINKLLINEQNFTLKEFLIECKDRLKKNQIKEIQGMLALYPTDPTPEPPITDGEEQKSISDDQNHATIDEGPESNREVNENDLQVALLSSSSRVPQKVRDSIENAKKKLEERRMRDEKKRELSTIKEEITSKALQVEYEKRRSKSKANIVLTKGDFHPQEIKDEIKLINIEEEEDRDSKAIKLFVKRYHRSLQFLFDKYAATSYSTKPGNFNELEQKASTITITELLKFLREGNITNISKEGVTAIVKLINAKEGKNEFKTLPFKGFKEFFVQVSIYNGSKSSEPYKPLTFYLTHLMQSIINLSKSRGENVVILENPEATFFGDPDILRELNKNILKNPNIKLPSGYIKTEIKQIKYTHSLPKDLGIKESRYICSTLLDGLLNAALGIRFFELHALIEIETKVIPKIEKMDKAKVKAKYKESNEKKESPLLKSISIEVKKDLIVSNKNRIPLSANMKVLVAKGKVEDKVYIKESAYVLEEVLFALDNGMGDVEKAKRFLDPKVKNLHLKKQLEQMENDQKEELKKESKRLERHRIIKQVVDNKTKKEEEGKKANEQKEKEDKKKVKEETKKKVEDIQKMLEEKKKAKEENKKKKQEEEKKKKEEEEKVNITEREKKQKEHQDFLNKQKKDMITKCEQLTAKIKEKTTSNEDTTSKIKEDTKKLYHQNKQREEEFSKSSIILQQKQVQFMTNPELTALFNKYDVPLKLLFNFFTKLEDYHVDKKFMMETNSIQFRTYMKFCLHYVIVPVLASTEEAVLLFRTITKTKKDEQKSKVDHAISPSHLNYEQFKEALAKLAALGKQALKTENYYVKPNIATNKEINMDGMSIDIVEKLFKYMKISPDDDKYILQAKFSTITEENAMQKKKPIRKTLEEDAADMAMDINQKAKKLVPKNPKPKQPKNDGKEETKNNAIKKAEQTKIEIPKAEPPKVAPTNANSVIENPFEKVPQQDKPVEINAPVENIEKK